MASTRTCSTTTMSTYYRNSSGRAFSAMPWRLAD
ncbi:hypothetical protein ABID59_004172 [Bradyrhizobium sp. S3.3.6]